MHLADAFIQSDLLLWLKLQAKKFVFVSMCVSLGIEPTTFCFANAML